MARGSESKEKIFEQIMKVLPDAFMYNNNKELRVNCQENGEVVQIKVTLTASKETVENPAAAGGQATNQTAPKDEPLSGAAAKPTQDELDTLAQLMENLGM